MSFIPFKINMNIIKEPFKFLFKYRIIILAFMIYLVTTNTFLHECCPFEIIFGIPCPSCGITRALLKFISFDFVNAFYYHPLFLLVPFIFIVIIYKDYKFFNKIYKNNYIWISLIIIFIVTFILRLVYQYPNEILKINENSLLQIIIRFIKSLFK